MEEARPILEQPRPAFADEDWDFVSRVSEKGTLRAFLKLTDEPAAANFIETYGLFRKEDTQLSTGAPSFVRKFWTASSREGKVSVALKLERFWFAQARLRLLLQIYSLVHQGGPAARAEACVLAQQLNHGSPEDVLTWELTQHLAKQVLVSMDFEGTKARPVLQTHYVLPGLYALIWKGFLSYSPLGVCLRCSELFEMTRPRKAYCSPSCRTAHKQARYRAKQKTTTAR